MVTTGGAPRGGQPPEVVALARRVRILAGDQWPVDPLACAAALFVEVVERDLSASLWGLTLRPSKIVVNAALPSRRKRFALAHELGHVVVACGWASTPPWSSEVWADRFGRELLAPLDYLDDDVVAACDTFDVEPLLVMSQLSMAGRLPALFSTANGDTICRSCGQVGRSSACPCAAVRYSALPAVAS